MTGQYTQLAKWYAALRNVKNSRAAICCLGDSITEGNQTTGDFDTVSWVSILRTSIQSVYGNGGEGFISPVHTAQSPPIETGWPTAPTARWSFSSAHWNLPGGAGKVGWGCAAGAADWTGATNPTITGNFDTLQVISGDRFDTTSRGVNVYIDGSNAGTACINTGLSSHANFAPGTVTNFTTTLGNHPVYFTPYATTAFLEGVRFLRGNSGVVVDRVAKGGFQVAFYGVPNDADYTNYNIHFKSLTDSISLSDTKLYVIMMGVNDWTGNLLPATFQSYFDSIVVRCLANPNASVCIVTQPYPSGSHSYSYQQYIDAMAAVANNRGCLFLDVAARWGGAYKGSWMYDTVHPNDLGHADIGAFVSQNLGMIPFQTVNTWKRTNAVTTPVRP